MMIMMLPRIEFGGANGTLANELHDNDKNDNDNNDVEYYSGYLILMTDTIDFTTSVNITNVLYISGCSQHCC